MTSLNILLKIFQLIFFIKILSFGSSSLWPHLRNLLLSRHPSGRRDSRQLWHTGVNFIDHLHPTFLYKSALRSFSLVAVWLCNFKRKNIGAKAARKMLMKLTTSVNLANILWGAFLYCITFGSFSLITVWICIFWRKEIGPKAFLMYWWNWSHVSLSPTFYVQLFLYKRVLQNFSLLTVCVAKCWWNWLQVLVPPSC